MIENFLRYEKKYLLNKNQIKELKEKLHDYITPDKIPSANIMSVYYDDDNFSLITKSIEKPTFKEKLRIRSYSTPSYGDKVYVELKKKLNGVVYKSRTKVLYQDVLNDISSCEFEDEHIGKEIKYLNNFYGSLKPKIFISCDREYYVGKEDSSLRVTFDENLKYRSEEIELKFTDNDKQLTDAGIMEIKVYGSIPLWLVKILNDVQAYPTGFSKVGNAFLKGELYEFI